MYFPEDEVLFVGEDITEAYDGWRMFFDGAANFKGVGIRVVLVSEIDQHYPISPKLRFLCTNNMAEYEACILALKLAIDMNVQELLVIGDSDLLVHQVLGEWAIKNTKILPYMYRVQELIKIFTKIEFKHVPMIQNEFADALAALSSMIQHPYKNFIDHIPIGIHKYPTYCAHVEEESDGNPWFHDIKEYLAKDEAKGKFSPNWKDPYMVNRVLTGEALILLEMDGEIWPKPTAQTQSRDTMFRIVYISSFDVTELRLT
ncbi:uncharacterized protein [Nicotiana sylvestris]|uniref:uncharacterized protein n=1 Tax=Nicotiana sylvestris TaxID=4096 RepID=UPI00388C8E93